MDNTTLISQTVRYNENTSQRLMHRAIDRKSVGDGSVDMLGIQKERLRGVEIEGMFLIKV